MEPPAGWYVLLFLVSLFGIGTWYIRNFTERVDLLRLFAFSGSICMICLLIWTYEL